MAMRSKRITCKTHPWVYDSKQVHLDLQQLNYDVKLMWLVKINYRMIAEELTEYLNASQIDIQVRQVLDRLWSSLM
jgi:hypothetical protein